MKYATAINEMDAIATRVGDIVTVSGTVQIEKLPRRILRRARKRATMVTKRSSANVPSGFKKIETKLAGFWKPIKAGQSVQGVVGPMIETKGAEDDKPNRFYTIRITDPKKSGPIVSEEKTVEVEKGDLVGVGGAMLLNFLDGREGMEVFLVYEGLGAKKPGKHPAKMYGTYAKGAESKEREPGEDDIPY